MNYRLKLDTLKAEKGLIEKQVEGLNASIVIDKQEMIDIEAAQVSIQIIASNTQNQVSIHIEDLVTQGLHAVFPDPYTFKVIFEIKRNKTEARLMFTRDGVEVSPMDSAGGGAIDIAAFVLRIALWAIGHSDNTLIFDEPFRFLSAGYQPNAGVMLKELSKTLGLQFIIVTHNTALEDAADRIIGIHKEGKISYARQLR